ncbi:MAG TPA: hypothetical protein VH333_08440 [Pseudonocardiaceae bacterium]|jgi:hypothetical protein|nr:hypothetical protein [Pseudonocardiaceae bacterium]
MALTVAPVAMASATTPSRSAVGPQTPTWVYIVDVPEQWICVYEGNQLVESGKYQAATCRAGTTGVAVWALTY